jgi:hypothetical protein
MAQSVTGALSVSATASEAITNGLSTGRLAPALAASLTFGTGTGANNVQYCWTKSATATAATVTYTLSALADDLGRSVPFTKVRCLVITHLGAVDAQPLTVGGAALHPWLAPFGDVTDKVVIRSGGCLVLAGPLTTGYAVTSGVSDQLMLDPGANTIPFKIMIMGE